MFTSALGQSSFCSQQSSKRPAVLLHSLLTRPRFRSLCEELTKKVFEEGISLITHCAVSYIQGICPFVVEVWLRNFKLMFCNRKDET